MSITLTGLTTKQRVFADVIWSCNGREEVSGFIRSLPVKDRRDATTVLELMIAAVFDDVNEIQPEVRDILDRIAGR